LLKEWPEGGPKLMWERTDLGDGYATPSIVGERLYIQSSQGMDDESLLCLSVADAKTIWTTRLGKVGPNIQQANYPGARGTPTIDGNRIYALGSDGDLLCLDLATGNTTWHKNLRSDFGGKPG